jgi:preprotein translocase subunit SecG
MQTILTVLHLFLALGLIGLVLIQHGKGADMGAAFGSGASSTVFGARGSGNFLSRSTAVLATVFFLTSMALAYFASQVGEPEGLMDAVEEVPAAPVAVEAGEQGAVDVPSPQSAVEEGAEIPAPAIAPAAPAPADVPAPIGPPGDPAAPAQQEAPAAR